MKSFVESSISNDFSLSIDTIAEKAKSYGRFSAWLNSDKSKIIEVLNIVKSNGVSPAFFAAYEKTEGYNSSWGWLNHTTPNGNYLNDADSVSQWIVTQSKNTTDKPAWIDFANYKDFVPENVKQEGNEHFANLKSGTIGRVVIAGTAAATWEVYYPNGLKEEYNGVQNYAAPITAMIDSIEEWGGSISGGSNPDPDPEPEPEPIPEYDLEGIKKLFTDFYNELNKAVNDMLTKTLYNYGQKNDFGNQYLKVITQMNNMYKLNSTIEFEKVLEKIADEMSKTLGGLLIPTFPEPEPEPNPNGKIYFPVNPNETGVNFWFPPYDTTLTSNMDYGWRTTGAFHAGYDIGGGGNSAIDVYATTDGVVRHASDGSDGWGFRIEIEHSTDEYTSMYAHLVSNSNTINVGDTVKAGQKIAVMGATGGNYAIHLHYELSPTGIFRPNPEQNTIDPKPYLKVTGNNTTGLPIP